MPSSGPESKAGPGVPPAFQVLNEIGIISQLSSNLLTRVLPDGLSMAQFTVLNHFVRLGDGSNIVELARAFQVSKPSMGETVARLAEKQFVTIRPDPDDGRSKRIYLTDAGRSARERSIQAIGPDLAKLTDALGVAMLQDLIEPLTRLRQWLDRNR
jgi:DNA-binding MarR family transcriptional regulator